MPHGKRITQKFIMNQLPVKSNLRGFPQLGGLFPKQYFSSRALRCAQKLNKLQIRIWRRKHKILWLGAGFNCPLTISTISHTYISTHRETHTHTNAHTQSLRNTHTHTHTHTCELRELNSIHPACDYGNALSGGWQHVKVDEVSHGWTTMGTVL